MLGFVAGDQTSRSTKFGSISKADILEELLSLLSLLGTLLSFAEKTLFQLMMNSLFFRAPKKTHMLPSLFHFLDSDKAVSVRLQGMRKQ